MENRLTLNAVRFMPSGKEASTVSTGRNAIGILMGAPVIQRLGEEVQ